MRGGLTSEHDGLDVVTGHGLAVLLPESSEDCIGSRWEHDGTIRKRKQVESWRGLLAGCRAFTGGLHMVMSATPSVPTSIVTCIIVPAAMTGRPGCSLDHSGRPSSLVQAINSRRRRRPKFPGRYRHDIRTSQIFFVDLNKV